MVPFAQDVTVTHRGAGSYSAGRWTAGASSSETIKASIQPAKYSSLMRLAEGDRTKGAIDIWSEAPLIAGSEATQTPPDLVTWQGEQWEVRVIDPWIDGHHAPDLSHYKAVAVRADR